MIRRRIFSRDPSARDVPFYLPRFTQLRGGLTPAGILALGPHQWFRFNTGITTATGVSQWADQSGNGRHLKQGTGSAQPTLNADGSILFDGSSQNLITDAFTALTNPVTIYALMRQISWTSNDYFWDGNTSASMGALQFGASPAIRLQTGGAGFAGPSAPPIGTYGVICAVYNGSSSICQVNLVQTTGTLNSVSPTQFTLGANVAGAVFANVEVKEVLLFNGAAHAAELRAKIIRYLARLGGVSV